MNEKSGFEEVEQTIYSGTNKRKLPCHDRSHNAPNMMVVPAGKNYRHVCPTCGEVTMIYGGTMYYD